MVPNDNRFNTLPLIDRNHDDCLFPFLILKLRSLKWLFGENNEFLLAGI